MDNHPEVGIAGSQFLSPDGELQSSPFRFMGILSELDRGLRLGFVSKLLSRWVTSPPTPPADCEADWVSGASMILRRSMLEQIGLLDEGLYTYFDDIDICLRAKRAGGRPGTFPKAGSSILREHRPEWVLGSPSVGPITGTKRGGGSC